MTTPDLNALIERLEGLLKVATKGPWKLQDGCSWRRIGTAFHDGNVLCPSTYSSRDNHPDFAAGKGEDLYANLTLIVEGINALPTLLQALRALQSERQPEEGPVMVPRYPTDPMVQAGLYQLGAGGDEYQMVHAMWTDMFDTLMLDGGCTAALPAQPQPKQIAESANCSVEDFMGRIPESGLVAIPEALYAKICALIEGLSAPLDGEVREIVERLRAKLGKATKRPWRVFSSIYGNDTIAIMKGDRPKDGSRWKEIVTWMGFDGTCVGKRFDRANAELIVEAVNALPELLTLIERLSTAQQEAGWQPIETAPKNTLCLLFEPHDEGGFCFVGCTGTDDAWVNNLDFCIQHPTHWQPLPAAPAIRARGEG